MSNLSLSSILCRAAGLGCTLAVSVAQAAADEGQLPMAPPFVLSDRAATAMVQGQIDDEGRALVFAALAAPQKDPWEAVHLLLIAGERISDQGVVHYRKGSRGADLDLGSFGLARWGPVIEGTRWGAEKPGGRSAREMPEQFAVTGDRYGLVRAVMIGGTPERGPASWNLGGPTGSSSASQTLEELLAIVRQIDGGLDRFVFALEEGAPILSSRVAVEDSGTVHILFERDSKGDALRYARLPPERFQATRVFESAWGGKPGEGPGKYGLPIGERRSMRLVDGLALAADPVSGRAMIATIRSKPDRGSVFTRTIHEGETGPAVPIGANADGVLLAAGGDDRFHALMHDRAPEGGGGERIVYRRWSDGDWAAPVLLGAGDALGGLLADRTGRVLAIWRNDGLLTGRWLGP